MEFGVVGVSLCNSRSTRVSTVQSELLLLVVVLGLSFDAACSLAVYAGF